MKPGLTHRPKPSRAKSNLPRVLLAPRQVRDIQVRTPWKRIWPILLLPLFLVVPAVVGAQPAETADQPDGRELSVSPAILEVAAEQGQTIKRDFYIRNNADEPLPLRIEPRPLEPVEEIIDMQEISTFNAAQWIDINQLYHIIDSGESRKLTASITVPKDAEPCGHYAMISVDALEPVTSSAKTGTAITPRIGIPVFITVPGQCDRNLNVDDGRFVSHIISSEIVRLKPKFKNTGTIHVMQNTKAVVRNIFGSKKAEIDIPPRVILPNTIKEVSTMWEDVPFIGMYKVQIEGSYGPGQAEIKSSEQFVVVFRWLPLLVLGAPLALMGWVAWRTRGRWGDALRALRGGEAGSKSQPEPRRFKIKRKSKLFKSKFYRR